MLQYAERVMLTNANTLCKEASKSRQKKKKKKKPTEKNLSHFLSKTIGKALLKMFCFQLKDEFSYNIYEIQEQHKKTLRNI